MYCCGLDAHAACDCTCSAVGYHTAAAAAAYEEYLAATSMPCKVSIQALTKQDFQRLLLLLLLWPTVHAPVHLLL